MDYNMMPGLVIRCDSVLQYRSGKSAFGASWLECLVWWHSEREREKERERKSERERERERDVRVAQ